MHSNTVNHGHYEQLPSRSLAQDNGKAPMSPDNAFYGRNESNSRAQVRGAPALDRQSTVPSLKRGSEFISGRTLHDSNTAAGHRRRRIGGDGHPGNAESRAPAFTSLLMQRKWCQVSQIPMPQEGGSEARPPHALELEMSIHFDLGALGEVLISARQNDSIMALANLALESVTLPQRLTATTILSKCTLYHDGGCQYALPYFPTGLAVGAAGLTPHAKVFIRGHHCIDMVSSCLPAVQALPFALPSCFAPRTGHVNPPTAPQRHGLVPRAPPMGRGNTRDVCHSPVRVAELLSMDIPILGGSARHSAWRRIEEDTRRGFVDPDLQLALAAAQRTFLQDLKQTDCAGPRIPSVQFHGLCSDTPARSVLRNMHKSVRQSGTTTFHLTDSDVQLLRTNAGQEFLHTLPFCQDELEHLRRTWASLSQWSEWCLHTGEFTDVSLALNVLVCNDGQPALPPLFWALVHLLLHQRGLDNDDTSEEEKAVICLWTAIAVRACLEWQCSLCAEYAHSRQLSLSQKAPMPMSIALRQVDTLVFPPGSTKYDAQSVSTLAEDFLHTLPLSDLPAPVSNTIALLPRSADDYGRRRLRIATLYSEQTCGIRLGSTSRDACTVPIALSLRRLCWACLPLQLWGKHTAGTWFQLSSFSEFATPSINLDSVHDAMTAHQLPFDAQDIHNLTYTFLLIHSRAFYVIAQDQVCVPYNGDAHLIPEILHGLPERARDMLTQCLYDSQQWQPALVWMRPNFRLSSCI